MLASSAHTVVSGSEYPDFQFAIELLDTPSFFANSASLFTFILSRAFSISSFTSFIAQPR